MDIEILQYTKNYNEIAYIAGRGCYNLKIKVPDKEYIKRLIKNGHESILEHIFITVKLSNVSRAFMAQITRHRLVSFSITSQHYSDYSKMPICDFLKDDIIIKKFFNKSKKLYKELLKSNLKEYARYCLIEATSTNIIMTTNIREWRLIFKQRCSTFNVSEMRIIMIKCLKIFYKIMPECFEDLINEYVKLH